MAGRGRRREPAGLVRARVRRRGAASPAGSPRRWPRSRAFFVLALSTQLIHGSQSYWQISPLVAGPWDIGPERGRGDLLPLPSRPGHRPGDVPRRAHRGGAGRPGPARGLRRAVAAPAAAAITAAGLLAAGTAVALAGTGKLDAHGMIAIPALHDAASDRPVRYTPVCSHTAIPVCLNPAYASYLPATAAALAPVLNEVAGLPGAPARISQAAATYRQGTGNPSASAWLAHRISGTPPVFRLLLPDQLPGPAMTTSAAGRRAAIKRRARHRGRRHRRRPRRIAGAAGGRGGADDGGRRCPSRPPPGIPPGNQPGTPPTVPAPGRRPMPRPGGSPRCRPRPGTPGWCGTWPRCGPAGSPWPSCHDRRHGTPVPRQRRPGRQAAASLATAGGTAPGAAARRQPAGSRRPWRR